ncbi:hypothetical protein RchiOBHm_Chr3g0476131 [Rosa chinensis]|uniref:Uncharacterized protein n=1 Tax=Rosa chinensis TaxID=74649 RepID=A0A2P6RCK7_ROSCH|nr:hypothetical protein RchiOBHm_Chr3g0476131 [Rosa chinensis]
MNGEATTGSSETSPGISATSGDFGHRLGRLWRGLTLIEDKVWEFQVGGCQFVLHHQTSFVKFPKNV